MLLDLLADSQLFTGLDEDERRILSRTGSHSMVVPDSVLITMGTVNRALFVVMSGSVSVERTDVTPPVELARLGAGAVIGEMSFVDGSKTSATVRTVENSEIFELAFDRLHEILAQHPRLAAKLWHNFSVELKRRVDKTNDLVKQYVDRAQVQQDNAAYADFIKCWC
jgi:CRP-like cAMP-binding protein